MLKHLVSKNKMAVVARRAKAWGIEAKLYEKENLTHGRIIWIRRGRQILIMR